jgi:hypothetical protein
LDILTDNIDYHINYDKLSIHFNYYELAEHIEEEFSINFKSEYFVVKIFS